MRTMRPVKSLELADTQSLSGDLGRSQATVLAVRVGIQQLL